MQRRTPWLAAQDPLELIDDTWCGFGRLAFDDCFV